MTSATNFSIILGVMLATLSPGYLIDPIILSLYITLHNISLGSLKLLGANITKTVYAPFLIFHPLLKGKTFNVSQSIYEPKIYNLSAVFILA
jgi:hypothetical protein